MDLPVLPRESPSGKIQTRYFPPRREILETNNSCSCSCSNSCSNLSHSWCMGEQLSYIHCWGVPQGSRSRPPASTGTLQYTPPVNAGNCMYPLDQAPTNAQHAFQVGCGCHSRAPKPISVSCVCRGAEARNTPFRQLSCQAREEKRKFLPTANSPQRRCQRSRT